MNNRFLLQVTPVEAPDHVFDWHPDKQYGTLVDGGLEVRVFAASLQTALDGLRVWNIARASQQALTLSIATETPVHGAAVFEDFQKTFHAQKMAALRAETDHALKLGDESLSIEGDNESLIQTQKEVASLTQYVKALDQAVADIKANPEKYRTADGKYRIAVRKNYESGKDAEVTA